MVALNRLPYLVFGAVAAAACLAGTSAQAQQRLLTCWYNEKNVYTGADDAQPGAKLGLAKTGTSGDYTWAYTMRGTDGGSCPRVRPQS